VSVRVNGKTLVTQALNLNGPLFGGFLPMENQKLGDKVLSSSLSYTSF